ncbi:oligoendopeptidase F [Hutsoniella sourekii]|uniref:oligoendopeptidase F n=1 Tax=Hutsoniella sourekii TaxID=87650 RepID=UPI000487491B|nr:oligoendopeptidase F [Hutsoniella sourekii]
MSQESLPKRSELPSEKTWDLSALFADDQAFQASLDQLEQEVAQFQANYKADSPGQNLGQGILELSHLLEHMSRLEHYAFLPVSADHHDNQAANRLRQTQQALQGHRQALIFFENKLLELDPSALQQIEAAYPQTKDYLATIVNRQKDYLGGSVEEALGYFAGVFQEPESIYNQIVTSDLTFPDFEVDGETYPLSFVLYEDYYMYHPDTTVRRAAFDAFYQELGKYQQTAAENYYSQVLREKKESQLRGYESVIDFLLHDQEVTRDMFDRQIDGIMTNFALVMRKYITHLKDELGLQSMTYADLKIDLDPEFDVAVSFQEAVDYVRQATQPLGEDYQAELMKYVDERWVDYGRNQGKESGAFATMAGDQQPYVLMSWSNQLSDVYTLIHELGHIMQMKTACKHNLFISNEPSLYVVEAPSTYHELLLSNYLIQSSDDPRVQRFARYKMITNTYFHNMVTHLLEATYQREVYRLIDQGQGFGAEELNQIKRSVIADFWGDAVELNPGVELTWMRQAHYYMGLYPYTYSASLVVSTQAYLNYLSQGQEAIDQWLDFLKLGTIPPADASEVAGVDVTTSQALEATINYLDQVVDEIIELSARLKA